MSLTPAKSRATHAHLRPNMKSSRRGVTLVFSMVVLILLLGMIAFAVDVGYMMLVRTQLQVSADASVLAAASEMNRPREEMLEIAREFAQYQDAGGQPVELLDADVEYGMWNATTRVFTSQATIGNAVRVTTRRDDTAGGRASLFFGRVLGINTFNVTASAVATANPRDIAFVVDLSGSMNDDTEPCWATNAVNTEFAAAGYPTVGDELMQQIFDDFGYGTYPGELEYVGAHWGVAEDYYAYANLTSDVGPLATTASDPYRIYTTDDEVTRKKKGYSAIIDFQIARVMPDALPVPDSSIPENYAYWEKYLEYILPGVYILDPHDPDCTGCSECPPDPEDPEDLVPPEPDLPPIGRWTPSDDPWFVAWQRNHKHRGIARPRPVISPEFQLAIAPSTMESLLLPQLLLGQTDGPGEPPHNRGYLPIWQDSDRVFYFNNPNSATFPLIDRWCTANYFNKLGYQTYVQFMMDHGRDLKPPDDESLYVPLSVQSPDCPWHSEATAAGPLNFPPRTQPMHAARRALIGAIQVIKERNDSIGSPMQRDWVSIISYDTIIDGAPVIEQVLTGDYNAAFQACTQLQAVGDKRASTATESGIVAAKNHIKAVSRGGQGREHANKVVVLVTDGIPNAYESAQTEIDTHIVDEPNTDFYADGSYWLDAPLMQVAELQKKRWHVFPVGVGLGTDYDFMDRMARMGDTADTAGESARGSGNPAEYEQRLRAIFEDIINTPYVRLVK